MENPYDKVQSNILSRIIANVERLNQSVVTLNQELATVTQKNKQLETIGTICENYSSSMQFNLETTGHMRPPNGDAD
ncbi:Dad4p KNAG_0C05480 [Huiozyma naganishii CBS 8797]|uniref:DASH complex subunit DAD4 n=1 Tax=Huiozyma naganishii (strain ATCC MYA-139 / BCRC 22969 / CBS 8797 / KCTC 17520 / NBRC 10181 / NCYC 3082 / Yp74L-3) TaxID=1071383 RepID=J7S6B0_HUIN7|nr:hypothetical protein KNAG_0C05480 [Kazachstania naganishii CBS 8797]CCK69646.1 hypothetical protein KNAG_0C05480 [Kazachstania naganishii CBS 8797]